MGRTGGLGQPVANWRFLSCCSADFGLKVGLRQLPENRLACPNPAALHNLAIYLLLNNVLSFELQVEVEIIARDTCKENYQNPGEIEIDGVVVALPPANITDVMLCAAFPGKGACQVRFVINISVLNQWDNFCILGRLWGRFGDPAQWKI